MITPLCAAAHLLTRDEARRIAANIAKLSGRRLHADLQSNGVRCWFAVRAA